MILVIIVIILIVAFIAATCTNGSGLASRQEDYLEECEKQKHKEQTNH